MKLAPGVRLGPYEIVAPLGAGGMGEVYRARDTRLGRSVAVKVLPAEFANDATLRIRLQREAKAVAALNHPHICSLFDIGDSYLVMEYCEGKTLAQRIAEARLPAPQVLEYGTQIADALENAHRQGIVHRDLKPSNIMLTQSGVKLLDFGLARQHFESSPDESTLERITDEGSIPGTVQYMAPEVLQGTAADARSDIFALGLVLYEMATAKRAFNGSSKASLVAAILEHEPLPVRQLAAKTPVALVQLIRLCLTKNPDDRIQTAHDVALQLRSIASMSKRAPLRSVGAIAAAAAVLAAVAGLLWLNRSAPQTKASIEAAPVRPTFTRLTDQKGVERSPFISPDGKVFVYCADNSGNSDIYLLRVKGEKAIDLTSNSPSDDKEPAFSPDGHKIAFRSERDGGGIFIMGAMGESPRRVTDFGFNPSWSPDGKELVVSTVEVDFNPFMRSVNDGELWAIQVASGEKRRITRAAYVDAAQPSWSPNGHRIAFWTKRFHDRVGQSDILTVSSRGGVPVSITSDASTDFGPTWSTDGRYIFFSSNRRGAGHNLWRVAVDEISGRALSAPEPWTAPAVTWAGSTTFSHDGLTATFCGVDVQQNIERLSLDPVRAIAAGSPTPLTSTTRSVVAPSPSPDGQWLAVGHHPQWYLSIMRRDGSEMRRLTDGPGDQVPQWSPDGKWIAFKSTRAGTEQVWMVRPDGSDLRQVSDIEPPVLRLAFSPDATRLAVTAPNACRSGTCVIDLRARYPIEKADPLPAFDEWVVDMSDWSADGQWLVGLARPRTDNLGVSTANRAGKLVIYSFATRRYEVLGESAMLPQWMSDSRRVLHFTQGKLRVIDRFSRKSEEIAAMKPTTVGRLTALSADDRDFYFVRAMTESDIWLMELKH